jgi:general secretion pathway protein A
VDALHRFLLETRAANRNVVLIIDEAQDLSPEVLEQVRLISNLETDTEKLIQIVLMGQSELRDLLARHELRQLAQRVTARYHLSPLSQQETLTYIKHRLQVADGEGKVGFDHDALVAVHRLSGGVPRLVNLICDRSLLAGYVHNTRRITSAMVRQAAREVEGERPRGPARWHHGMVAAGLTLALAVLAFWLLPRGAQAPDVETMPPVVVATPTPVPTPIPPPPHSARLDELVRTLPRDGSFASAAARVQAVWGATRLARAALRSQLEQLRAFDLPAAVELSHPSRRDTCFAALLRLDERAAGVAIGSEPEFEVPLSQLDGLWTQDAVVWWPEDSAATLDPARTLSGLGFAQPDLAQAVASFQQQASLVADGQLGPRTRMALFARSAQDRPRLSRGGTSQ